MHRRRQAPMTLRRLPRRVRLCSGAFSSNLASRAPLDSPIHTSTWSTSRTITVPLFPSGAQGPSGQQCRPPNHGRVCCASDEQTFTQRSDGHAQIPFHVSIPTLIVTCRPRPMNPAGVDFKVNRARAPARGERARLTGLANGVVVSFVPWGTAQLGGCRHPILTNGYALVASRQSNGENWP